MRRLRRDTDTDSEKEREVMENELVESGEPYWVIGTQGRVCLVCHAPGRDGELLEEVVGFKHPRPSDAGGQNHCEIPVFTGRWAHRKCVQAKKKSPSVDAAF